jgi:hypothetical protein
MSLRDLFYWIGMMPFYRYGWMPGTINTTA